MSEPEEGPEFNRAAMHIPGAGTFGMFVLIGSLSMLFAASLILYSVLRSRATTWAPPQVHGIPPTLWISTVILLGCSVAIHLAISAVKQDREKRLVQALIATVILGLAFLALQMFNWAEFYSQIPPYLREHNLYMATFFILTGLHAAHVLGGLIPLVGVTVFAAKGKYSRNFHPGVRYCTIYWHFLDITWVAIMIALFFGSQ